MPIPKSPVKRERGRPKKLPLGIWRHPSILYRRVCTILRWRDADNEESITDVVYGLRALARRVVPREQLPETYRHELRRLGVDAEPWEIVRVLQAWRFNLTDRAVCRMEQRPDIMEMRWA
jgi:hypothetical protein